MGRATRLGVSGCVGRHRLLPVCRWRHRLPHRRSESRPAWRIGIEHPHDPSTLIAVVPIRSGAVATSGTAHRGAISIDPRTGQTPSGVASVTVIAASLTWADIDATAAYVQGRDAARWLGTRPIRSALMVWADGTTTRLPKT